VAFYTSNLPDHFRKKLTNFNIQFLERPFNIHEGVALALKIKQMALDKSLVG
jgi:hypothetical protein